MTEVLRRRVTASRDLIAVAGFTLLALVTVGAFLLLAAKLQYPQVGAGGSPIDALSAAVIAGLGALRVPIRLGGLTASALPLGALATIGWAAVWGMSRHDTARRSLPEEVRSGLALGLWLGPACGLLSLIFRLRVEPAVSADFWWSLVLGALWGALFGAVGALVDFGSLRDIRRRAVEVFGGSGPRGEGLRIAIAAVAVLAVGATLLILSGVIAALLSGKPRGEFGVGDALAGVVYFAAFWPNLLISVLAVAFGSSISLGAQITAGGRQVGPLQEISLFDWPPDGPPAWALLLILLPLGATVWAGVQAHRRITPEQLIRALGWAAGFVAVILFCWAALAEARLGAGILDRKGFARLAPNPGVLAFSAILWTFAGGAAGWYLAKVRKGRQQP